MTTLKLTQIGNSLGLIVPREVLARLKRQKGDTAYLAALPYLLTPNASANSLIEARSTTQIAPLGSRKLGCLRPRSFLIFPGKAWRRFWLPDAVLKVTWRYSSNAIAR